MARTRIPMSGSRKPDPPSAADRHRLRVARTRAKQRVEEIAETKRQALGAAFWEEIGAVVRSVSPFLVSLMDAESMPLDRAVRLIEPAPSWPRRPRLSKGGCVGHESGRHIFRYYLANISSSGKHVPPLRDGTHGHSFDLSGGGWARILVVGHSLEVDAHIGPLRFETRFGVLRIEMESCLPETLAMACVGKLAAEIVDHPALSGRDWRITDVEAAHPPFVGQTLVSVTGTIPYRMPRTC